MSLLAVGLSHHSAPIAVLERAALDGAGSRELTAAACASGLASEALVLSTCNRLELYAVVDSFHPALVGLSSVIAAATGLSLAELNPHLTFHHGDAVVERLMTVTSGLDSMALGESQIMGQVRAALRRGQEDGTVGRVLDPLVQTALRVGKRVHSETGIGGVGRSLVDAALEGAAEVIGDLSAAHALVVGAGSMSALAATTLARRGVAAITVVNRTPERAARLAGSVRGVSRSLTDPGELTAALTDADVVISCTGAVGHVLDVDHVEAAQRRRGGARQLIVDLALPRDVDPGAGEVAGVTLLGLAELHERCLRSADGSGEQVHAARAIIAAEVSNHAGAQRAAAVAPVVAALRVRAQDVVDVELSRLRARLGPGTDPRLVAEAELAVHRVVDKLLHTPSVRVKALAAEREGGTAYAHALQQLFALDGGLADPDAHGTVEAAALAASRALEATRRGSIDLVATEAAQASTASGLVSGVLRAVGARTSEQS